MKKLVVYIFLFVLFCFGPFSELLAQTLVVRGRVVDGQTGEILSVLKKGNELFTVPF